MRRIILLAMTCVAGLGLAGSALAATPAPTPEPTSTPSLLPGEIRFSPGLTYTVPTSVTALAVDDFNLDGFPDLVTVSTQAKRISILLGDGLGEFTSVLSSDAFGKKPVAVATGDLNGDTFPDVAVADQTGDSFAIFLGRGDGSLGPPTTFRAGNGPSAIAIGDFDGELEDDVAVANLSDGTVSFFFNRGTQPLALSPANNFPSRQPFLLETGDFNDDGSLDVLALNQPNALAGISGNDVTPLLGNGFGGFTAEQSIGLGISVKDSVVGDFNNDGIPDLAVTNSTPSGSAVTILLADGFGSFTQTPQAQVNCSAIGTGICFVASLAAGDFDNDGNLDIAITATGAHDSLLFFLGNGDGTLTPFGRPLQVIDGVGALIAADFDNDGRIDLAYGSAFRVQVLHNITEMVTPRPATATPTATETPTFDLTQSSPGPGTPSPTPRSINGAECNIDSDCLSGICSQNKCCDRRCDGITERCDQNPVGICAAIFTPKPTATQQVLHIGSSGGCSTGRADGSVGTTWGMMLVPAGLWLMRRRSLMHVRSRAVRHPL